MKRYLFLLILLTCLVYLNSFGNSFVWDDVNNIVNNDALNGPVKLRQIFLNPSAQIFYRPIPYLTVILDYRLWGSNPFGYHLTNFLFHLFNVILILHIARHLTNSPLISFICASLFGIHPIHTEAITYISGRSDPICMFFLLSSFLLYLKSLYTIRYKQLVCQGWSLLFFLFGLLSKEIAIIFPLIILAYNSLYLNSSFKVCLKKSIPFLMISALFLVFRYIFADTATSVISLERIVLIPKILLYYIMLLTLPFNLHMQHNLRENHLLINLPFMSSALIFLGVILIGWRLSKKRFMRFGLLSFFIGVLPFLGFLRLNAELAEHWLYFASFGFFLFISGVFTQIKPLIIRRLILSIAIVFFSILTLQRNTVWQDDISIYQNTLKYRPNDPKLHYNLGNAYLRKGLLDAAAKEYSVAIEGNPGYAYALNNLGIILEKQKDIKAAYQHYKRAITLEPTLDAAKNNLLRLRFISLAFAEEESFEHSLYAEALNKFVKDGRVNYAGLKDEPYLLNAYLEKIAKLEPRVFDSFSRDEKLSLYINVYNAFTLKVIIEHYPIKSIRNIFGVWDRFKVKVAGSELTLNQIEHEILRKKFKEPRIHFALVCASKGCPKLTDEPFNGKDLNDQLERESRRFINHKTKVMLDKDSGVLNISSIFKWFSEDFGDLVEFISKYLPEDERMFIRGKNPRLNYLKYDWSLNE